jgi:AraC family transcriptional regulator of adaptative response/methylated-DNA-[protein]-cysteine methyltransferase
MCVILTPAVMISVMKGRATKKMSMRAKHPTEEAPVNEAIAWESVLHRDSSADDRLRYGVTTTGIYCRPSCPSRRPKRDNVAFFSSSEAAERAGFRACRRCRPNRAKSTHPAVERARDYIDNHIADLGDERITLELLGEQSGLSPYHLQRKFKELLGVSPAQYIRARKSERLAALPSEPAMDRAAESTATPTKGSE